MSGTPVPLWQRGFAGPKSMMRFNVYQVLFDRFGQREQKIKIAAFLVILLFIFIYVGLLVAALTSWADSARIEQRHSRDPSRKCWRGSDPRDGHTVVLRTQKIGNQHRRIFGGRDSV